MVGLYLSAAFIIILKNIGEIPLVFMIILQDAFTGTSVAGGAIGDGRFNIIGKNVREIGVSDSPTTLLPRNDQNNF